MFRGKECHGGKTEANGSDDGAHGCGLAVAKQKARGERQYDNQSGQAESDRGKDFLGSYAP
jgi:hypothetical protein